MSDETTTTRLQFGPPPHLPVGAAIRHVRKHLFRDKNGAAFNQDQLAQLCRSLEEKEYRDANRPIPRRKGRLFAANATGYAGRTLSEMERGKALVLEEHLRILEQALELPAGFLAAPYRSEADVENAYREHERIRLASRTTSAVNLKAVRVSPPTEDGSFLVLPPDRHVTEARNTAIEEIEAFFSSGPPNGRKLLVLHGEYGTGKSFMSGMWWSRFGRERYASGAIRIDCSNKTTNQIIREITRYFWGQELEGIDETIVQDLDRETLKFILLDQIRLDNTEEQLEVRRGASPLELLRSLSALFAAHLPFQVLMVVQSSRDAIHRAHLKEHVPRGVQIREIELLPMNPPQGAELLRLGGCSEFSNSDLEELSARLQGLPPCLIAAAKLLSELHSPAEREAYLVNATTVHGQPSTIGEFISGFLKSLANRKHNPNAHPEALFRLLALMPGPTHKRFLERLVRDTEIARMSEFRMQDIQRMANPFIMMSEDRIDLHPMAREHLRIELDHIAKGHPDPNTNPGELARIHLSAARQCYEIIAEVPRHLSLAEVEAIEGTIFHLLRYRDVSGCSTKGSRTSYSKIEWAERIFSGDASANEITDFCYQHIAAPYLFDSTTRLLGQFETKAKILCYFFKDRRINVDVPSFSDQQAKPLLFEIAVCFQHSGRLKLALLAASNCLKLADRQKPSNISEDNLEVEALSDKATREWWTHRAHILVIKALIEIRLGSEHIARISAKLAPHLKIVERLFAMLGEADASPKGLHSPPVLNAMVRLYARAGHLKMLKGEIEAAISLFEKATAVEMKIWDRKPRMCLSGEPARRYVVALIRGAANRPDRFQRAEEIVEANIAKYEEYMAYNKPQNDIIPFHTLSARLSRARGDLVLAKKLIDEVGQHEYVRAGECTLAAHVDLNIERTEIRLAAGEHGAQDTSYVQKLARDLEAEHHLLMAAECRVLYAKLLSGASRNDESSAAERRLAELGVFLWHEELEQMRAQADAA